MTRALMGGIAALGQLTREQGIALMRKAYPDSPHEENSGVTEDGFRKGISVAIQEGRLEWDDVEGAVHTGGMNAGSRRRRNAKHCEMCGAVPGEPHHQEGYTDKIVTLHTSSKVEGRGTMILCMLCRDGANLLAEDKKAVKLLLEEIHGIGTSDIYTDAHEYSGRVSAIQSLMDLLGEHLEGKGLTLKQVREAREDAGDDGDK